MPGTKTISAKRDYGKWRALTLGMVYLLMGIHIAHWKLAGRTLAPLEFNEVLYTVHLGIITAGFIFMGLTIVATLIFGRFFCSWMCHMLALQDGCAWLLNKVNIKPKHIRSRTLLYLPFAAVLYLFLLPQIERAMTGQPPVSFHIAQDAEGWASFMTNDFWRNLPSVGITLFTFVICGGLTVYVLGTRSFCYYGCPYGMVFALADRLAPGKIKLTGSCTECGKCTAACTSHIQVMKEVNQFDRVVDPNCLKDLDCIQVCPEDALSFGMAKPAGFASLKKKDGFKKQYDFSIAEDISLAVLTFIFITIYRGLYDTIPFLLAIAFGILFSFGSIVIWRVLKKEYVRFGHYTLKQSFRITGHGKVYLSAMVVLLLFTLHSAFIHTYTYIGEKQYSTILKNQQSGINSDPSILNTALKNLTIADQYGVWHQGSLQRELAALNMLQNNLPEAEKYLRRMLDKIPEDMEGQLKLGKLLILQKQNEEAAEHLKLAVDAEALTPREQHLRADAELSLGHLKEQNGFASEALPLYQAALKDDPENPEAKLALGVFYTRTGKLSEAEPLLNDALNHYPNSAMIENNLAIVYMGLKRLPEAQSHFEKANILQPGNVQVMYNLAMLLHANGHTEEARRAMEQLLAAHPDHKNARLALEMMNSKKQSK